MQFTEQKLATLAASRYESYREGRYAELTRNSHIGGYLDNSHPSFAAIRALQDVERICQLEWSHGYESSERPDMIYLNTGDMDALTVVATRPNGYEYTFLATSWCDMVDEYERSIAEDLDQ